MVEALRFFRSYEVWIYFFLGLVGIHYLRRFFLAWQELHGAAFGLERESAQERLNRNASILILLMALAMGEFIMVSFLMPATSSVVPITTPTINLLATSTITLMPETNGTPPVEQPAFNNAAVLPTEIGPGAGCISGQIEITSPQQGSEVRDLVDIIGNVNIPDFGFYKLELRRPGETTWLTILAGNEIKQATTLGSWNTNLIQPGEYQLGLVAVNNQGIALPACIVQIRIAAAITTEQP